VRRDRELQLKILRRVEAHEYPFLLFTQILDKPAGFEDEVAPGWSDEESYNIRLMLRDGLLALDKVTDAPWFGSTPDDVYAETYVTLTSHGHDFLEAPSWWTRAYKNVATNIATLITAVLSAVLIQLVLNSLTLK